MRLFNQKSRSGTNPFKSRRGVALPIILIMGVIITGQVGTLGIYSSNQMAQIKRAETHAKTFYVAEAAVQKAIAQVRHHINTVATIPDEDDLDAIAANILGTDNKFTILDTTVELTDTQGSVMLDEGDYEGLRADVNVIQIAATVRGVNANEPAVTVRQEIEVQQIPVFQFGVFYDNDLEILPGPTMTFAGPVHTNQDLYVGANNSLVFDAGITAGGDIYHGRKNSSENMTGDIRIKDSDGVSQSMKNADNTWLDSTHANWLNESQTRWSGNVKSEVHNTRQLNLPIPVDEDMINIIERRDAGDSDSDQREKLDYKAKIRIIDGQILDENGASLSLSYCSTGGSLATCDSSNIVNPVKFPSQSYSGSCNKSSHFQDNREDRCVRTTRIDIAELNESPAYQALLAANPDGIVIYHSDLRNSGSSSYRDALRLEDGEELEGNTTFASENAVYIKGDFNTVNKKTSGIISDAVNILSNSWSDSNSTKSLSNRVASNTEVNAAIISGNLNTSWGHYNGGFENLPRFLEKWSGKTFTFSGSVAVLYNSQESTGEWGQSDVYSAPNRNWSYDTDLNNNNVNVPGFPSVINISRGSWEQDD